MIAVFGLGGGGTNIVSALRSRGFLSGVITLTLDSDISSGRKSEHSPFLLVGPGTCRGWGSGKNSEVAELALTESMDRIREQLYGVSRLYVITSLGGGMGGASYLLAKCASEMGIEVISLVTLPFSFEGRTAEILSRRSVEKLELYSQEVHVFNNQSLLEDEERARKPVSDSLRSFDLAIAEAIETHS